MDIDDEITITRKEFDYLSGEIIALQEIVRTSIDSLLKIYNITKDPIYCSTGDVDDVSVICIQTLRKVTC
jgi:hypothetical protein